ncbi:condensation domain-containing protein [Mastigocoleus testarum]|uniref:Condensation domain-containing protein n=1 Tax=Mastigocoleus testarum BC008 TaxID=371196 RepID=A0A0V7ZGL7_9CYAN|nr:condensation domain-containing protein [Mastigocoleus testarum]KST63732.1 hypothetical protein BC008_14845 [Mastigocoleus testarum BC008]
MENKIIQVTDSSRKTSICRPLGAWEKLFWLSSQAHPAHVGLTAKIRGEFSIEQLKKTLTQVQQRHPLLRVRIAFDQTQQPWFVEDPAEIPLRIVARQGEQHWQQEIKKELSEPFVCTQAPLLRIVLLHSPNISELLLICDHCICDGISTILLTRDILQLLATPDTFLEPLSIIPATDNLIPSKVDDNILSGNSEFTNTSWIEQSSLNVQLLPQSPISPMSAKDNHLSSETLSRLKFGSLSPKTTKLLICRCKEESTTIYGAICAAFSLAIARQNPSEEKHTLQCFSAINIRQYLKPMVGENFGYYAHGISIFQSFSTNEDLWEIARSFKNKLKEEMIPKKIFEDILQMQEWMSKNPTLTQVQQGITEHLDGALSVSNLGRLQFPTQFGNLQLEAMYGPIGILPGGNQWLVGSVTVGEQLFLTLTLPNSSISLAGVENILEDAINLLNMAVK